MKNVFTEYLIASSGCRENPHPEHFEILWQALRSALIHELKKRGLWSCSPSYVGVEWASRWYERRGLVGDALDELVTDCYALIFLERESNLRSHLEIKENIDGLVIRAIQNLIHDRQKSSDPVGYRVFDRTCEAVLGLIEKGVLFYDSRGQLGRRSSSRKRSDSLKRRTILKFAERGEPSLASSEALSDLTQAWNNQLIPGMINGQYKEKARAIQELESRIAGLPEQGVHAFRFQDLVESIRSDARLRFHALLAPDRRLLAFDDQGDGTSETVLRSEADTSFEEYESLRILVADIITEISNLEEADARTRRYILKYLKWGVGQALGFIDPENGSGKSEIDISDRKLARILGIPRERLPHIRKILRRLL